MHGFRLPSGSRLLLAAVVSALSPELAGQDLEPILQVEAQPLKAQVRRVVEALHYLGNPLSPREREDLDRALAEPDPETAVRGIQRVLDPRVLALVHVNPESRVKVAAGPADPVLVEQGWRSFLLKVHNEAGVTAVLEAHSPQAAPVYAPSTGSPEPRSEVTPGQIEDRWLDLHLFNKQPLRPRLSGLEVEYRILEVLSRDEGRREATLSFHVGQGTQDIGFRNETSILFRCLPSVEVLFDVQDAGGGPAMASFEIRDRAGRVYPSPGKRLAPDFFFHPQVYRTSGETVRMPPGVYTITYGRGPEYRVQEKRIVVPEGARVHPVQFHLERWIHLKELGWYSGDHHVHGGGCAHYESPTAGVTPGDMLRHQLGEDLNVACVLSWGPCWYFQKQFFEGKVNDLSRPDYLMRYDVEVSGFPSQHAGHLCLLRLKEDDYPGTERIEEWPSWDLPILQWGKEQGGVVGFSHSGWGLAVQTDELPNYEIPPFDGIGANEYIVDVVHDAVDFISTVDTPSVWELNIWYHTLNCGYRTRISGETDFPCIYGERVGLGRVYCRMDGPLEFDAYCDAIRAGRSYVSDGRSHLIDLAVDGLGVGELGSELRLEAPGTVTVTARAAALLPEEPDDRIRAAPYWEKPYWHPERARVGDTRRVPVEVVVNGRAVAREEILADGSIQPLRFEVPVERSSWIALRILPSAHTNPVFVLVGGKPVRASRRSARWCLESVDRCWESKVVRIRRSEQQAAREAYEVAREAYRRILSECEAD